MLFSRAFCFQLADYFTRQNAFLFHFKCDIRYLLEDDDWNVLSTLSSIECAPPIDYLLMYISLSDRFQLFRIDPFRSGSDRFFFFDRILGISYHIIYHYIICTT